MEQLETEDTDAKQVGPCLASSTEMHNKQSHVQTSLNSKESDVDVSTTNLEEISVLSLVVKLWNKVESLAEEEEALASADNNNKVKVVCRYLHEIVSLLTEETCKDNNNPAEAVEFCLQKNAFWKIYNWTSENKDLIRQLTNEQLILYNNILSFGSSMLIRNRRIIEPLILILLALRPNDRKHLPIELELSFFTLLRSLSMRLVDETFMELFSKDILTEKGYKIPKFVFIDLLVSQIHKDGEIGDLARESLLLCTQISIKNKCFGEYLAQESSCCVILAAGLSGHYSSLPTTLPFVTEDWYCITDSVVSTMQEIKAVLRTLKLCCEVLKSCHRNVKNRLLSLIHDGFFCSVIAPALNQEIIEARMATVAYLELFIREINDTDFMKLLLKFLLTEEHDGRLLIDSLISFIKSSSSQLGMVTLQLFKTLMELNCEDVMFHLIIRYLVPCTHILPVQKKTIKELDFYCKSATMFLYLTPTCCLDSPCQHDENDDSDFGPSNLTTERSIESEQGIRQQINYFSMVPEVEKFSDYLLDSRRRIRNCKHACDCWSAVYDGMDIMTEIPRRNSSMLMADAFPSEIKIKSRSSSTLSSGSTHSTRSLHATDCLGPFINALFDKLEQIMDNTIYVNLQLTALISRMACYHQPLIRSFLLNSNLVMQPGVRSLFQILTTITNSTDMFVVQLDDHAKLICRARQNLIKRERKYFPIGNELQPQADAFPSLTSSTDSKKGDVAEDAVVLQDCTSVTWTNINKQTRGNTLMEPIKKLNTSPNKETRSPMQRSTSLHIPNSTALPRIGGILHPLMRTKGIQSRRLMDAGKSENLYLKKKNPTSVRNAIYCAVLLEEWLKELAAISLEHNLI